MFFINPAPLEAAPSSANSATDIVDISPEQVKNIGDSVLLNCTVNNPENHTVIWEKKHPVYGMIFSMGKSLTLSDARFGLNVTESPVSYILKVI